MSKCVTPNCGLEADPDVSSQGHCLRCVWMHLNGIDPQSMMIFETRYQQWSKMHRTLNTLAHRETSTDMSLWDSREQYLEWLVNDMIRVAKEGLP